MTLDPQYFQATKLICTDMDGTLTVAGQFTPKLLFTLNRLQSNNIAVVIATGRSAGWCSGLALYLPGIHGVIAENGGLFYKAQREEAPHFFFQDLFQAQETRQKLETAFKALQTSFPDLEPSADNTFRLTDWTFDKGDLSVAQLSQMKQQVQEYDLDLIYSSVQVHIKLPTQSKGNALQKLLTQEFPELTLEQVVTVGDSPNDQSLFEEHFSHSVAVANIQEYWEQLDFYPNDRTNQREGHGFIELAECILKVTS
jgi:HAD superfamily hydrolase (TIGR01484 family)